MWCALQLDKLYDPNAPEDDQMERYEEMNRMREHVMKEIDKNDDRMVSLDEFVESTKRASYEKEEGWEVRNTPQEYRHQLFCFQHCYNFTCNTILGK